MKKQFIGILLVIIGVALIVWGYNIYNSLGSQISRTFSGDVPFQAWVGMIGGAICLVMGVLRLK